MPTTLGAQVEQVGVQPGVLRRLYGLERDATEGEIRAAMTAVDHYIAGEGVAQLAAAPRRASAAPAPTVASAPTPAPAPSWPAQRSPFGGPEPLPAAISLLSPVERTRLYGEEAARAVNATVTGVPITETAHHMRSAHGHLGDAERGPF